MNHSCLLMLFALTLIMPSPLAAQSAGEAAADSADAPTPEAPTHTRTLEMPRQSVIGSTLSPEPQRPRLVDWRDEATVRDERDRMQRYADLAQSEAAAAKTRAIQTKALVDVKKSEISALDKRIKDAKKAKLDAERKSLEAEKKRQELMRDFFDRVLDVEFARDERSTAQLDYGRAIVRTCDFELQLLGMYALGDRADDHAMLKAEQQFLDSWKLAASAREKVAEREQSLADRKLRVYKAWMDHIGAK